MTDKEKIASLEKELTQLRELHLETEKLSLIGSYQINLKTGTVHWTSGIRRIFEISDEEPLPTPEGYYNFVHPDEREQVKEMFENSAVNNAPFDLKYKIILASGKIKTVYSRAEVMIGNDDGRILFGFLQDISEEAKLVSEIEEHNRNFQLFFNSLQEGVSLNKAIYDDKGNIIDHQTLLANPAFNKHSFYKAEDVIGKYASEIYDLPPDYIKNWWIANKDSVFPVYTELYIPEGDRWMYIYTSELVDDIFTTSFIDATEQKKAQIKISESEEKYRKLVENAPFGFLVFSLKETQYTNHFFAEMLHIASPKTICKKHILSYVHKDDKHRFKEILKLTENENNNTSNSYHIKLVNKELIKNVEILITKINENNTTQWQCIVTDITERTKIKNKAKRLSTDALYLSRKIGLFSQIGTELSDIIKKNELNKYHFQGLFNLIKAEVSLENLWHIFQENFELVFDDFFKKLLKHAPNLTQQELKHCAFIKMCFETKDIAVMFNVKPATIQMARVRMKKKLNLTQEQELLYFILTL